MYYHPTMDKLTVQTTTYGVHQLPVHFQGENKLNVSWI